MRQVKNYFEYVDEYSTCQKTHATLRIYLKDEDDPHEISAKLGLQPSRTQVHGELYNGKKKSWPTARFLNSETNVQSKDLRRHIDWLLDQLQGKSELIQQFHRSGYTMVIDCFWTSAHGHGGPMLDPKILKRLAALGIGIGFDIYFDGDEDTYELLRPVKEKGRSGRGSGRVFHKLKWYLRAVRRRSPSR